MPHLKSITSFCLNAQFGYGKFQIMEHVFKNLKKNAPNLSKIIFSVEEENDRSSEYWDSLGGLENNVGSLLADLYQVQQMFESNGIETIFLGIKLDLTFIANQVTEADVEEWNNPSIEFPIVFGTLKFRARCSFETEYIGSPNDAINKLIHVRVSVDIIQD